MSTATDPFGAEKVLFMARPKWWNIIGRYRWWRLKRDLKAGIFIIHVPGGEHVDSN